MSDVATWEDGPEYAPVERPYEFVTPAVAPLAMAPPVQQMAALAPKERPSFGPPPTPVAPLELLKPVDEDVRDPQLPFDVVASAMTSPPTELPAGPPAASGSAWSATHWSPPVGPPAGTPGPWGPPTENLYPAPGTPGWFGPGPAYTTPPTLKVSPAQVFSGATPGVLICLGLGGLIPILSPVLFIVAAVLSNQAKVAKRLLRIAFAVAGGLLVLLAIVGAVTNDGLFSDWWDFVGTCALVLCWAMLITTVLLVWRALRRGEQIGLPGPTRWG